MKNLSNWNPFKNLDPVTSGLEDIKNMTFTVPSWMSEKKAYAFYKWRPALEILENEHAYLMKFDFEGIDKKDVHVKFEKGNLTIKALRVTNSDYASDKSYINDDGEQINEQVFERTFVIPPIINQQRAEARYEKGVLNILLPKQSSDEEHELDII